MRLISAGAVSAIGIGIVIGVGGFVTDLGIGNVLIVGASTGLFAFNFQDYMNTRRRKSEDFGELLTLSSLFYQSPATINAFLKTERVHASIENLLQATLGEEIGSAYWRQAVAPYIGYGQHGFKENWRYDIDLKSLSAPTVIGDGGNTVTLEPSEYWELHTTLCYRQTAFDPHPVFHIACGFESMNLPTWFKDVNYFLREIVPVREEDRLSLARLLPAPPLGPVNGKPAKKTQLKRRAAERKYRKSVDERMALARKLFNPRLRINDSAIEPDNVWADQLGLRWSYALSKELREQMTGSIEVEIELTTVQHKTQRYFPVYLTTPTRNPTIRFDWGDTPDIQDVEVETFFSAERPYDEQLRQALKHYGRIEVRTRPDDWVFVGSGCIFVWN